jgi:protein-L-isoaspartate(D-aspartate) O-methyltransferase
MTLYFTPAGEADAETLVHLARMSRQEDGHSLDPAWEAALRRIAGGEPLARAWLLREQGEAIGYVVVTLGFSIEYGGRDGFIDELYLVPAARGRGLGRKLLDFALARAGELGIGTLHLEVETGNARATRLYHAAGFEETGRRLMRLQLCPPGETGDELAHLAIARRWFAEELRYTGRVQSPAVVDAFAAVPRERFVGPGPWRVLSPMRLMEYWTTADADPRHLYHDVLIAIDEARRLNNGQPSLWARLYDELRLTRGSHVVHVGAGTGYYSAILAEIVGGMGEVTAIEIDPELAARARENLAAWPQVTVVAGDGFTFCPSRPADAIIVNAGVSHLSLAWLDPLAANNGRLLVPLTTAGQVGASLLITRRPDETHRYLASFVSKIGMFSCVGGRDARAEARLKAALARSDFSAIRSLRRPPDEPDESCWLQGDGW